MRVFLRIWLIKLTHHKVTNVNSFFDIGSVDCVTHWGPCTGVTDIEALGIQKQLLLIFNCCPCQRFRLRQLGNYCGCFLLTVLFGSALDAFLCGGIILVFIIWIIEAKVWRQKSWLLSRLLSNSSAAVTKQHWRVWCNFWTIDFVVYLFCSVTNDELLMQTIVVYLDPRV